MLDRMGTGNVAVRGRVKSANAFVAVLKRGREVQVRKEHPGEVLVALEDSARVRRIRAIPERPTPRSIGCRSGSAAAPSSFRSCASPAS